jgi:hypothetical protein
MMASLRQQKEAFVSGHSGTSLAEVSAVTAAPVALLLLWRMLQPPSAAGEGLFRQAAVTPVQAGFEFVVLVLPQVAHLLGMVSPMALLGGTLALVAALLATQSGGEWQRRGQTARQRSLLQVLR